MYRWIKYKPFSFDKKMYSAFILFAIFSQLSIFDNIIQILNSKYSKINKYSIFVLILFSDSVLILCYLWVFYFFLVFVIFELFSRTYIAVFCLYSAIFSRFCYPPGRFSVILRPNHWKRVDLVLSLFATRSKVVWWLGWTLEVVFIHSIYPT